MNITVNVCKHETVSLSDAEARKVTIQVVTELYDIPEDAVIIDGQLYGWSDPHPHSGSQQTVLIRKATDRDKFVVELLKDLT